MLPPLKGNYSSSVPVDDSFDPVKTLDPVLQDQNDESDKPNQKREYMVRIPIPNNSCPKLLIIGVFFLLLLGCVGFFLWHYRCKIWSNLEQCPSTAVEKSVIVDRIFVPNKAYNMNYTVNTQMDSTSPITQTKPCASTTPPSMWWRALRTPPLTSWARSRNDRRNW